MAQYIRTEAVGCPDTILYRIKLPETPAARYLRLTIEGQGVTYLDEVLAWGDTEITPANQKFSILSCVCSPCWTIVPFPSRD